MTIDERIYVNALAKAHDGEYRVLDALIKRHGSWRKAWQATQPTDETKALAMHEELERADIHISLPHDDQFPPLLKEIPWSPLALYVRGAPLTQAPTIAIVGTRRASQTGLDIARRFAKTLAAKGVTIVSGLALGIDAAAHAGALEAGGKTIAVLAGGVESIYPKQNERLGKQILEQGGSILSEYPMGTPTYPNRFIERNRIVSGLSQGIIVIEAPEQSGALATARFALDQNREVFVVPGSITNSLYAGSHALIKAGASLVTDIADVLDALSIVTSTDTQSSMNPINLDVTEQAVFNTLRTAAQPLAPDAIADMCHLPIETINRTLGVLLMRGVVNESGIGYKIA